jgi:hypothetical protein
VSIYPCAGLAIAWSVRLWRRTDECERFASCGEEMSAPTFKHRRNTAAP